MTVRRDSSDRCELVKTQTVSGDYGLGCKKLERTDRLCHRSLTQRLSRCVVLPLSKLTLETHRKVFRDDAQCSSKHVRDLRRRTERQ